MFVLEKDQGFRPALCQIHLASFTLQNLTEKVSYGFFVVNHEDSRFMLVNANGSFIRACPRVSIDEATMSDSGNRESYAKLCTAAILRIDINCSTVTTNDAETYCQSQAQARFTFCREEGIK